MGLNENSIGPSCNRRSGQDWRELTLPARLITCAPRQLHGMGGIKTDRYAALLHDGNAAKEASGAPVIYEVLPRVLRQLATQELRPVVMRDALTN